MGQLDVQVISDIDLNELRQPHVVRHECKPISQPGLERVGEVSDTPPVQWLRLLKYLAMPERRLIDS